MAKLEVGTISITTVRCLAHLHCASLAFPAPGSADECNGAEDTQAKVFAASVMGAIRHHHYHQHCTHTQRQTQLMQLMASANSLSQLCLPLIEMERSVARLVALCTQSVSQSES